MVTSEEVIKFLEKSNQIELSEIVNKIKEKFGIKETLAPAASAGEEQKTKEGESTNNVSVIMKDIGPNKIKVYGLVMNVINELKGEQINIIQAKKKTEEGEKIILADIPSAKAQEVKNKLETEGAKVEIK